MKVVILAGGLGTRLSEETVLKPKPMVEIGGRPILWHIMKIYSHYGYNDFILCLGYKGYMIKEYFANYCLHMSDVTFDMSDNSVKVHQNAAEPWKVTLIDTGEETQTGGRVKRIEKYIDNESFMLTYGDGVSDIDISRLVEFHNSHTKIATVTAVQPPGRYGSLEIDESSYVKKFYEKKPGDGAWINGGFFVFRPDIFTYLRSDTTILEREPLEEMVQNDELAAYRHYGFWRPMDTLRDRKFLEEIWENKNAPWRIWD